MKKSILSKVLLIFTFTFLTISFNTLSSFAESRTVDVPYTGYKIVRDSSKSGYIDVTMRAQDTVKYYKSDCGNFILVPIKLYKLTGSSIPNNAKVTKVKIDSVFSGGNGTVSRPEYASGVKIGIKPSDRSTIYYEEDGDSYFNSNLESLNLKANQNWYVALEVDKIFSRYSDYLQWHPVALKIEFTMD